ncbi:phosphoadenylyl-sulfate reductase [Salinivibrio sp. YCSC6]|uniref:phosphoadenylyl-sulfate reductase n=1 Tax=Salinivibrio sp. YCSC6 TaxID=2003370 RepID=UPI000BBBBA1D|nr:phosphoadenylyl-sulfate reductase [Salinivibrio sp. YCSC6]PCE68206.1 phosphoadenosine phosphosulfate reductase [Salinivibrio sp. YCSC6]QCF34905.1 phosphoadenylyl-sulfate reductase [Salinivibrio sp. YCSC6]
MPDTVYSALTRADLVAMNKSQQTLALAEINAELEQYTAQQRIRWALEHLDGQFVLSSSFGIQAALMLHMVSQVKPDIPVILTDTGYLFQETYQFIDHLQARLKLNLNVYRSELSPAWQEARYGKLWEQGVEGITRYNQINKVAPMKRALTELNVGTWFSGLRHGQSQSRAHLPILSVQHGVFKFLPVVDWSNKQVHAYLTEHDLPYHPLWEQGYVSVGDVHTTQRLEPGMSEEQTRFFGLKRECGLHEDDVNDGAGI